MDLPDREESDKPPWENLCGGAYFYLDRRPARSSHHRPPGADGRRPTGRQGPVDDVDLADEIPDDDCLIALLPDWEGNTWYVTQDGRVGVAGGTDGGTPLDLAGEIANSIAADDTGVYLVTTEALVKVALDSSGQPEVVWQRAYDHGSQQKPGQLSAGSGTTPTLLPSGLVAITDNADPQMHVQFYDAVDGTLVCEAAGVRQGRERERQLPGRGRRRERRGREQLRLHGPWTTWLGRATPGGLARVDADPDTGECSVGWRSDEVAPTSVAKVSLATGLVYAYTTRTPGGARARGTSPPSTPAPARRRSRSAPAPGRCSTTTTPRSRSARTARRTSRRSVGWSGSETVRGRALRGRPGRRRRAPAAPRSGRARGPPRWSRPAPPARPPRHGEREPS